MERINRGLASADEAELKLVGANGPRLLVARGEEFRAVCAVQAVVLGEVVAR